MKTVSVKLEIPDGWELVCDHMRPVKPGEFWINYAGAVTGPCCEGLKDSRVIVRKAWQWPEWLACAAVVRTKVGHVWLCAKVPNRDEKFDSGWDNTGVILYGSGRWVLLDYPDGPWQESLRINPNLERRQ
jgi:hypothetical protein